MPQDRRNISAPAFCQFISFWMIDHDTWRCQRDGTNAQEELELYFEAFEKAGVMKILEK
jgi:hypothetical protein